MADNTLVTKIKTSTGDHQIDYNALANLPDIYSKSETDSLLSEKASTSEIGEIVSQNSYNKAEILSDDTKTAFGLGNTAVPDDAFSALSKAVTKKIIMEHTWETGNTSVAYVDLTSLDYSKRIIFELGCGENYNSDFNIGLWQNKNSAASGNYTYIDMRVFEKKSLSSGQYLFRPVAYPNVPVKFELINTGALTSVGAPKYIQFNIRYNEYLDVFIGSTGLTTGFAYLSIQALNTRYEGTGFKIYELS